MLRMDIEPLDEPECHHKVSAVIRGERYSVTGAGFVHIRLAALLIEAGTLPQEIGPVRVFFGGELLASFAHLRACALHQSAAQPEGYPYNQDWMPGPSSWIAR